MVSVTDIDTVSTAEGRLDRSPTTPSLVDDVHHAIQRVVLVSGPYQLTRLPIGRFELARGFGDTIVSVEGAVVEGASVLGSRNTNVYHFDGKKETFLFPAEDWGREFLEDVDAWFEEHRIRITSTLAKKK